MWRLRKSIHGSWFIALGSTFFVLGVASVLLWRLSWWFGVIGLVLWCVGLWWRRAWALPFVLCGGALFGVGVGSAHLGSREAYSGYLNATVTIAGRLKEDVTKSASGSISLQLDSVYIDNEPHTGTILVTTRAPTAAKRGEVVTATGTAREGFGSFPMTLSSARIDFVTGTPFSDVGRVVRDWFADKVRALIREPQASLGIGFLTGQKSALPEDLSEALRVAGLTHIVVASGYNLTILVRLARKLFLRVSKYLSAVAAGSMVILFMSITGLSPSMTRAGLVSGLSLLSWYYGHSFQPFVLLPFAAAITVGLHPSYVWGDLGWQLSFAAFAGVMIVAPLLQKYFFGDRKPGLLGQLLGETVSAHAVTLPIIALSFGTVSNVAIFANILVVPLVPLAMLLTFACGLWSIAGMGLGWLIATPTSWLLGYMTTVATFVSELSWAQTDVALSGWAWVFYVLALVVACFWMWRATKYNFRGNESLL